MAEETETAKQEVPALTEEDLKTKKTIYVKNQEFPADFNEEQLKDLFKDCGTVVNTTLLRKPTSNELRGTGFVEFETHEAAAKAVKEYNNKLVGNGRLGVVFSTSSGPKESKPQREVAEGPTLFVRSLNYKVRSKQLKKEFGTYGKVKCRVNKKGYAFIEFESTEVAKKAKDEMNGKELEGKAIEIFFAVQRDKPEKKETEKKEKEEQTTPEKKTNKRKRKKRAKAKPKERRRGRKE